MKLYQPTLTALDLKEGKANKCHECPWALALKRCMGDLFVSVSSEGVIGVRSNQSRESLRWGTPAVLSPEDQKKVTDSVHAIDQGFADTVEIPITITVGVP